MTSEVVKDDEETNVETNSCSHFTTRYSYSSNLRGLIQLRAFLKGETKEEAQKWPKKQQQGCIRTWSLAMAHGRTP